MSKRVYIAARFADYEEAAAVREMLTAAGHKCTSRWIDIAAACNGNAHVDPIGSVERQQAACDCYDDIDNSDALLVLMPRDGGAGLFCEMGYAQALDRQSDGICMAVLTVGPARERTVFGELTEHYFTTADAIAAIGVLP